MGKILEASDLERRHAMTDVTIQRGALRMTIKGTSPLLVSKGTALIVTDKVAPIAKATALPKLRLVQAS